MKQFYKLYKNDEKLSTVWAELSWSINRIIIGIKNPQEREFYLLYAKKERYRSISSAVISQYGTK
jgi:hypothetical protein